MSDEIKRALTADEWASRQFRDAGAAEISLEHGKVLGRPVEPEILCIGNDQYETYSQFTTARHRHALAALALHGQPFGFTWEMVDAIRDAGRRLDGHFVSATSHPPGSMIPRAYAAGPGAYLSAIADRIAALLPPREK